MHTVLHIPPCNSLSIHFLQRLALVQHNLGLCEKGVTHYILPSCIFSLSMKTKGTTSTYGIFSEHKKCSTFNTWYMTAITAVSNEPVTPCLERSGPRSHSCQLRVFVMHISQKAISLQIGRLHSTLHSGQDTICFYLHGFVSLEECITSKL